MKVYLLIGTHLPELRTCLDTLAGLASETGPVQVSWPGEDAPPLDGDPATSLFLVLDPRAALIDQLERLAERMGDAGIEPVKVVACVDCAAAETSPQLRAWLDAAIYYADVVLLGNRAGASKRFIREFETGYGRRCYPCLFLLLKGAGVPDHPLEILAPDTRRLSQLFDLEAPDATAPEGLIIEASCDLDLDEPETDPFRHREEESSPGQQPVPDVGQWVVDA
jgi:hypothetical protein